jgi:hypothetical protein
MVLFITTGVRTSNPTFQQNVSQLRKKLFKHAGNANKTAVCFGMPLSYTVDAKGAKEFKTKIIDYEKQHVKVMLCITAHGHILPLHIILSHIMMPWNKMVLKVAIVCAQKNRWMTDDLIQDRVKNVWERQVSQEVC